MTGKGRHFGKFELDSADAGSLVDYSSDILTVTGFDFNLNTAQHHTPGSRNQTTTYGGNVTNDGTIAGKVDPTSGSFYRVCKAWEASVRAGTIATRTFRWSTPDASTAGSQQRGGEVYLKSLTHGATTGGSAELNTFTVVLTVDGAVTDTTVT